MEYRDRVYCGASFLDAVRPGWHDEIDLEGFDLTEGWRCILGQLFGDWGRLAQLTHTNEEWKHWADLGFVRYMSYDSNHPVYRYAMDGNTLIPGLSLGCMEFAFLENEWRSVILARRASR